MVLLCLLGGAVQTAHAGNLAFSAGLDDDPENTDPQLGTDHLFAGDDINVTNFNHYSNYTYGTFVQDGTQIGNNNSAVFTQTGGSFTANQDPYCEFVLGVNQGVTGTYNMSGSTSSLVTNALTLGYNGTGIFNMQNGSITATSINLGGFYDDPGQQTGRGLFTQNAGTVTATGGLNLGSGVGGYGEYTINGGVLNAYNIGVGSYVSTGKFTQTGGSVSSYAVYTGTGGYNISGGSLATTYIIADSTPMTLIDGTVTVANLWGDFVQTGGSATVTSSFKTDNFTFSGGQNFDATQAIVYSSGNFNIQSGNFNSGNFEAIQGTLQITGGSLNTHHGALALGHDIYDGPPATATLNLKAGSVSTGDFAIANGYSALVNQTGGDLTTNGYTLCVGSDDDGNAVNAVYNLSGGTLSTGRVAISESQDGGGLPAVGIFNQSGGTFTTNGADLFLSMASYESQEIILNQASDLRAEFNLSGGSASTGKVFVGGGQTGADLNGYGVITQTGGTFTTNGNAITLGLYKGNTTEGDTPDSYDSIGRYNLDAGTLTTGEVHAGNGLGYFTFNGGTLQAGLSNPTFFHDLTIASVQAGGAIIDSNDFDITISQSLVTGTATGTPDGGLTKIGQGTLTLTGASTYTGDTLIKAGTLFVRNTSGSSTGSGNVSVSSGGILGGGGSIAGNVTIAAGGELAPGGDPEILPSHLTVHGSLTLPANSLLSIALTGPVLIDDDVVTVDGSLTLSGDLDVNMYGYPPTIGQNFLIIDNTSPALANGTFANTFGPLYIDNDNQEFLVNYGAIADSDLIPNDVSLTYIGQAVPEPSLISLFAGALPLMLMSRRFRRAKRPPQPHGQCVVRSGHPI